MADTEKSSHITDHPFEPSGQNSYLCGYGARPCECRTGERTAFNCWQCSTERGCSMAEAAHRETTVKR